MVPNRDLTNDMSIEIQKSVNNSKKTLRGLQESRKFFNQWLSANQERASVNSDLPPPEYRLDAFQELKMKQTPTDELKQNSKE